MIRVKLREKPIKGNQLSLYYDYYPPVKPSATQAETRREFTRLFLYSDVEYITSDRVSNTGKKYETLVPALDKHGKPKKLKLTADQIRYNTETRDQAAAGLTYRQGLLNRGDYSFLAVKAKTIDFITHCENIADQRKGSTSEGWVSFIKQLKKYSNGTVPITSLNRPFCESFKKYLLANNSHNTAATYFNKFKAALREAYELEPQLITTDLSALIEAIPEERKQPVYLTEEELRALISQPCEVPELKNAAIFSALTGLRYGDIEKMTWSELQHSESYGDYIAYTAQKTKKAEVHPITKNALKILGKRGEPGELVFPGLSYSSENNDRMRKWVKKAGVTKHVVFHSFRHTYATLLKERGADMYVIKRNMAHSDIKTTEGYAAIRDPARRAVADLMDDFDLSNL